MVSNIGSIAPKKQEWAAPPGAAEGRSVVHGGAAVDLPQEHRLGFRFGDTVNFAFGGNVMHLFDAEGKNMLY